jgi:hypothetical protein
VPVGTRGLTSWIPSEKTISEISKRTHELTLWDSMTTLTTEHGEDQESDHVCRSPQREGILADAWTLDTHGIITTLTTALRTLFVLGVGRGSEDVVVLPEILLLLVACA